MSPRLEKRSEMWAESPQIAWLSLRQSGRKVKSQLCSLAVGPLVPPQKWVKKQNPPTAAREVLRRPSQGTWGQCLSPRGLEQRDLTENSPAPGQPPKCSAAPRCHAAADGQGNCWRATACLLCGPAQGDIPVAARNEENWRVFVLFPFK